MIQKFPYGTEVTKDQINNTSEIMFRECISAALNKISATWYLDKCTDEPICRIAIERQTENRLVDTAGEGRGETNGSRFETYSDHK